MARRTRVTIVEKIYNKISKLEVGDTLDRVDLVKSIYNNYDYFIARSFDVSYSKAKNKLPGTWFKTIKGKITRLK